VAAIARPPGPKGRWLDGSLRAFRRDPLRFLEKLSEDCGPLGYFRAGHQHIYFANDPSLVEEVLVTQNSAFIKSRILQRAKALLGEGLLTNEGASHLRQRRLVQPAFHRQRLMGYAETMAELALRARERWKDGEEMDIDREMMRLTLAIVGRTLFSADVEDEAPMVGEAMNALLETMPLLMLPGSQYFHLLPLPAMRRFKQAGEMLDRTIYRIIEERRRSGEDTGDLLSMLLLATDAEGDGQGMTDRQVRDETLTLFLAGHETTATALTWTWYLLAQNPEVERKMQAEVDAALGGRAPGFADLPALPYCEHVLAESMRLYPPAWGIGRMATREVELGGYNVPPGSIVLVSPYIMQRRAEYWQEPDRFWPERWDAPEKGRPKFAYFPFGGGPRICVGERFAWMEGILILAAVAQIWRFRLPENARPVGLHPLITLRPRGGIRLRAKRR
jgi:cytochrome P450